MDMLDPRENSLEDRLIAREYAEGLRPLNPRKGRAKRRWVRCGFCGKQFTTRYPTKKYCSPQHNESAAKKRYRQARWRTCPLCNERPILTPGKQRCGVCARRIVAANRPATRKLVRATVPNAAEQLLG